MTSYNKKKIIGFWKNHFITYIFYQFGDIDIHWLKENIIQTGTYSIEGDEITIVYGDNFLKTWKGKINYINDSQLSITDMSNQIGVVDLLYRKEAYPPQKLKENTFLNIKLDIITVILFFAFIIGAIGLYGLFEPIIHEYFLYSLVSFYILFVLIVVKTRKWLTIGLSNSEKDAAVIILAVIVYGFIFFQAIKLMIKYNQQLDAAFIYFIKVIAGSFILWVALALLFEAVIYNLLKKRYVKHANILLYLVSIVIIIIVESFFGDKIVAFLGKNWYYFLGGFFLLSFLVVLVDKIKKKTNPNNRG